MEKTYKFLESYYNTFDEDGRLGTRVGQVEFLTAMRYIDKYLFDGARVLDVGAGTGRYSLKLAARGFSVDALELIPHNIEIFKSKITAGLKGKVTVRQGDACDLSEFKDNTYDLVLIFGPLYHLFDKDDKKRVLSEALRTAKAGGVVFAAYCISDASILDAGFKRKRFDIEEFIKKGLVDPDTFAAKSKPELLFDIVRREDIDGLMAGLNVRRLHYAATDLYSRHMRTELEEMDDKDFLRYLDYHFSVCERADMVGITHHSLDIFRKL